MLGMYLNSPYAFHSGFLGIGIIGSIILIFLLVIIIALKGWALWVAAKNDQKGWFIALLIVNTFGILELIYLIFVMKVWPKRHHHHDHTHHHGGSHHDHSEN